MSTHGQPLLLVEDNPEDREATERAFRRAGLHNPIVHCANGDQALAYLQRSGQYAAPDAAPRPGVILLDLNMPGTSGREVLAYIKGTPALRDIPVIVLTTSRDDRDIADCYRAGANTYVHKPVDLEGFMRAIQRLKDYWFEVAILPRHEVD